MENASKALIIAGSVLIALMIIGALLLMFNNLSTYQESNIESTRDSQVVEFNNQYSTYNRTNVRGSDLYSLLNKAVDYNERKSSVGTEGAELAYTPITITFTMDIKQLTMDGKNRLFKQGSYTISNNTNTFENDIIEKLTDLENAYGADTLTNLTTAISKIFPENPTEGGKNDAVTAFKNACKKTSITTVRNNGTNGTTYTVDNVTWNDLAQGADTNGSLRNNIYTYYEYVQFKRAYFDCDNDNVEYNSETGRITEMEFNFTGKFN